MKVYPRVCGGTRIIANNPPNVQGLSPRVRGNLGGCQVGDATGRSIPACAGEPLFEMPFLARMEVYPRVCGGTALSYSSFV